MADITNYPEMTDELLNKLIGQAMQQYTAKDSSSPLSAGLLSAGLAMMAGSRGRNFGEALGQGGLLGLQAYGTAKEAQKKDPTQLISLLNAVEDLKGNREMSKLSQRLAGGPTVGPPQFAPAEGLPADTPQQLYGMYNRGDIDLSPNALTGKPIPPEQQGGLYGSMVTPPPTYGGNVPITAQELIPAMMRPKNTAAVQNVAKLMGLDPTVLAPGGSIAQGGQITLTAPNLGPGQKMVGDRATMITDYLQNIKAIEEATAGGKKAGEEPYAPAVMVPTGNPQNPTETKLVSAAGQRAIGAQNTANILQGQQPPPAGLPATPEMQDFLAKNGVPNRIDPNTGQLVIGKAADAFSRSEPAQRPLGPLGAPSQTPPQQPAPGRMGVSGGAIAEKAAELPLTAEAEYQKGMIAQNLKIRETILNEEKAARAQNASIDRFMQFAKDPAVAKGRFAETISGFKNAAASFNVDIKGLSAEQAMSSITNEMALGLRSTASGGGMPGAMSEGDRGFLQAMPPGLNKVPGGNELIAETFQTVNNRKMEVSRMMLKHEMEGGKIDAGFLKKMQDYADKNPLFGEEQQKKLDKIMGVQSKDLVEPPGLIEGNATALWKAQSAIQGGADPHEVKRRLIESGYSTKGLR